MKSYQFDELLTAALFLFWIVCGVFLLVMSHTADERVNRIRRVTGRVIMAAGVLGQIVLVIVVVAVEAHLQKLK
jgi:hypothetical protein